LKILEPALRQYRHNNNDDFVFGYDKEETENIVAELIQKIKYPKECNERTHTVAGYWYSKYK
jgi:hypothetical protein